jgi:hemoglobin/transferrin/lactoferrin receptor protein
MLQVMKLALYKSLVGFLFLLQSANTYSQVVTLNDTSAIDEVVISASKWNQIYGQVPLKVTSISAKDNNLYQPQTAADLLGNSGKVFIQKSQQGGGSPMIRGFATNRLLYSVDGVRMNTAIFRSGNIQNVINMDPFATEKTEVLFGPGSVVYGSDAIGGVMSFQTLTPQFGSDKKPNITGKLNARYSTANKENTGHFDVNIGWRKFALLTSFSTWDFDHLRQGSNGPDDYLKPIYTQRQDTVDVIITQDDPLLQIPSAYSQVNLMQKLRFKPNEHWDFQYGFHYSTTSSYGRYDRHNRYKNGNLQYAEWDYGPQSWRMHNLLMNHRNTYLLFDNVALRIAQQQFGESRIDRSLNSKERKTQTEKVSAFTVNLDLLKSVGARNTIYYGLEYVLNEVVSTGYLTDISTGIKQIGPSRYPQATWKSLAAYVNNEFRVTDKVTLQTGMRLNQYILDGDFSNNLNFYPFPFKVVSINNSSLTGSLGGVYKSSKSLLFRANLGTAFRAPNVDDIGKVFDSESGALTVPNPNLEAEYSYSIDFGVAKVFSEEIKFDVSLYYTYLDNAMVRRPYTLNGQDSILYEGRMSQLQAMQNAAFAKVYGFQLGIEIKLPAGFMLLGDINYQKGEEELEDGTVSASRHAAPFFGVTRLRYQLKKLSMEVYGFYQAERSYQNLAQEEQAKNEIYAKDANGNNYAPQWYTLNFKGMLQLSESVGLSAGIENITDQRYRPYSSGISGAGRNFVLAIRASF